MDEKIKRIHSMIDYIEGTNERLKVLRRDTTELIVAKLSGEQNNVDIRISRYQQEINELTASRNKAEVQLVARFKIFLNILKTTKRGVSTYDLWLDDFDEWLETQPDWVQELSHEVAPIGNEKED